MNILEIMTNGKLKLTMINNDLKTNKYQKYYNSIEKNKKHFEYLLTFLSDKSLNDDKKIGLAKYLLDFLTVNPTGYFYSNILEKFFVNIAQKHDINNYNINFKPKSVLHVMTTCYEFGGHTRVVERWIDNTKENYTNSVILLNPEKYSIPKLLKDNINMSNGELIQLQDNMNIVEKALHLREIGLEYEYIVLHTHMQDPIATIAFGTEKFTRPVLFFNHADHMFWIGKTISDVVLDIRTKKSISPTYRNINDNIICPIPCDYNNKISYSKTDARKQLNIDNNDKIIMTSASFFKFKPIGDDSIFDVYEEILTRNKTVKLVVIGTSKYWNKIYKKFKNRVTLLTEVPFPEYLKYVYSSDLIIDSYPMNGETTLIDAMRAKVPFLSLDTICSGQNDYVIDSKGYCKTKSELIDKTLKCLVDNEYHHELLENELTLFEFNYSKENWIKNLEQIYSSAPKKHKLREISNTETPYFINDYSVVLSKLYAGKRLYRKYGIPNIFEIRRLKVKDAFIIFFLIIFGIKIYQWRIK